MNRGFTLIELLVVIAIIGVLASVVLVNLNGAREKSRDAARKAQLEEVAKAFELYYAEEGTYHIPNTGSGGYGVGWFSWQYGSPSTRSTAQALADLGFMAAAVGDPLVPLGSTASNGQRPFMRYCGPSGCANHTCITADLENPSADDIATLDNSGLSSGTITGLKNTYSQSYAVCVGTP